jgi:hypothetical protein
VISPAAKQTAALVKLAYAASPRLRFHPKHRLPADTPVAQLVGDPRNVAPVPLRPGLRRQRLVRDQRHQQCKIRRKLLLRPELNNGDFHRAIALSTARSSTKAAYANGRLSVEVDLQPGERWHACLLYTLEDGAARFSPPRGCIDQSGESQHGEMMAEWLQTVAKIETSNEEFYRMFRRALEDMAALRLPIGRGS